MVHPYSRIDTTTPWKNIRFSLTDGSDILITDNPSIVVHAFVSCMLLSFSVGETIHVFIRITIDIIGDTIIIIIIIIILQNC